MGMRQQTTDQSWFCQLENHWDSPCSLGRIISLYLPGPQGNYEERRTRRAR